jgi:hypothetical protein
MLDNPDMKKTGFRHTGATILPASMTNNRENSDQYLSQHYQSIKTEI